MYLAVVTRPDIFFPVGRLAQFVETPAKDLWVAAKRVLRYISGTMDEGITFNGHSTLSPVGYSDSNWGGCKINRKSTGVYMFMKAGRTDKLEIEKAGMCRSILSEVEYMALASAVQEAIWLEKLLTFTNGNR